MTQHQFSNFLRIMTSIDHFELRDAGLDADAMWDSFTDDPYAWFIRASDADAAKVWAIIERRARQ